LSIDTSYILSRLAIIRTIQVAALPSVAESSFRVKPFKARGGVDALSNPAAE
jgi:hypothetical protein